MRPIEEIVKAAESGQPVTPEEVRAFYYRFDRRCSGPLLFPDDETALFWEAVKDEKVDFPIIHKAIVNFFGDRLPRQYRQDTLEGALYEDAERPTQATLKWSFRNDEDWTLRALCLSTGCGVDLNPPLISMPQDGGLYIFYCHACGRKISARPAKLTIVPPGRVDG